MKKLFIILCDMMVIFAFAAAVCLGAWAVATAQASGIAGMIRGYFIIAALGFVISTAAAYIVCRRGGASEAEEDDDE